MQYVNPTETAWNAEFWSARAAQPCSARRAAHLRGGSLYA